MSGDRPNVLARSDSARAAMKTWERAYKASPQLASEFAWPHVVEFLEQHPGQRVYEVGFGSGMNLRWALENGWEVAGCEVAYQALAHAYPLLPGADLRKESIVDCSAPSAHFDVVIDRAALSYLSRDDLTTAIAHIHRILKAGGFFLFNPYGPGHTMRPPDDTPEPNRWDLEDACSMLPDDAWEVVDARGLKMQLVDGERLIEHTLRIAARKR
jgi:SAM-dependent methyltransferase